MLLILLLLMQSDVHTSRGVILAHEGGVSASGVRQIELISPNGTSSIYIFDLSRLRADAACALNLGAALEVEWHLSVEHQELKVTKYRCLLASDSIDSRLIAYSRELRQALAVVAVFKAYLEGNQSVPLDGYWCASQRLPNPKQDWVAELVAKFEAVPGTTMTASIQQKTIELSGSPDHFSRRPSIQILRGALCISAARPLP